jgi:opacity protein-like surface antigen
MKSMFAAATLAALILAPAYAACVYPQAPAHIPDGNTATLAQMLAGEKAVQDYNSQMVLYLHCLTRQQNKEIAKAALKLTKKQVAAMRSMDRKRHNAAVKQLMSVANEFNAEVLTYKKKHKHAK